MTSTSKFIIRTSDRGTFRRCRQLWDFRSPIRRHLEFVPGIEPLDFGIGIHAGLDVYYDPPRWDDPERGIVCYEAELAFLKYLQEWQKRLKRSGQWEAQKERHLELTELGLGMLQHYWKWAPENDDWRPVKSEIEFEVPIPIHASVLRHLAKNPNVRGSDGYLQVWDPLTQEFVTVYYQGRIDLIIEFEDGTYGILDHKTAAQFGQTEHLDLDTQCRSYAWAMKRMLKLDIRTIIYSELAKRVPKPPRVLQSGALSVAKNQATTYDLYMATIKDLNHDPAWYADFLDYLKYREANDDSEKYFRRIPVDYRPEMLEMTERAICMEAIDMLTDPFIYPNPDRWNCNGCAFRTPCLLIQEGGDAEWHLENSGFYERSGKSN